MSSALGQEVRIAGAVITKHALQNPNLLTIQLQAMGDRTLSSLALTLFVFMAVLHILEQAFHGTVTLWAVEQAAQGQSIPSLYEQLRRWITPAIQHVYMLAVMLAMTL